MGTIYMILSVVMLLVETILQLFVVTTHSGALDASFIVILVIVVGPIVFINVVSAIQVTRTQDFSGKTCGRALCIVFHCTQLGIVWRALKLLILYDSKDLLDYLKMRLFHSGFQSLPFVIVLSYKMILEGSKVPLDIVTLVMSMISASIACSTYTAGIRLYEPTNDLEVKSNVRVAMGISFLTLSSLLVLSSRCIAIVVFSVQQPYWIALPLALHFIVHVLIEMFQSKRSGDNSSIVSKVVNALYLAFVNIFDMITKDGYTGVKCGYVLFYTVMLIENLTFSLYWMITYEYGDQMKLLVVLAVLMCFIVGLIIKCASCGYIFNVKSDILSDAFDNPELSGDKKKEIYPIQGTSPPICTVQGGNHDDVLDYSLHEIRDSGIPYSQPMALTVDGTSNHGSRTPSSRSANVNRKEYSTSNEIHRRSNAGSMSPSSHHSALVHGKDYDNQAFVQSQGNLSHRSHHSSNNRDSNRHSRKSQDISTGSNNSKGKQRKSKGVDRYKVDTSPGGLRTPIRNSMSKQKQAGTHPIHMSPIPVPGKPPQVPPVRAAVKPTVIVSDISKHSLPRQDNRQTPPNTASNGNLTLASSHSKYSRNTNTMNVTLNSSFQNYGYNGFEDPYREIRQMGNAKPRSKVKDGRRHHHHQYYINQNQYARRRANTLDCSLDSSEMYPSMTSDSSSVSTSFTDRLRRKRHQRMSHVMQDTSRDGYTTDISNSDYLSFNDYSMEDSSSWTESSSESSSDGAATWPPSQTANLLKMFNIPDRKSSTENILHWLDSMLEQEGSQHDTSFSTLHAPSLASDTDISLSAMQTFEIKKEKKRFKRLISKPKGLLLKFSSLNYKGKERDMQNRAYPLTKSVPTTDISINTHNSSIATALPVRTSPVYNVQESIV